MSDLDEQIHQLRQQHESILQSAGEGIYGLDADGRANFVNAAAQDILGWTEQDLIGEYIHDRHHHSRVDGSPYPREECPIYAALSDGKVHRDSDQIFWHKDGRAIPVEYVSTPIRTGGRITGAVVMFSDITARKAAESDLRDAFDQINRLKTALERERDYLRDEYITEQPFGEMVGNSAALRHMLAQIKAVAQTNANVLILGESGVGKELVARAIHRRSRRSDGMLVRVNCATVPNELFESEFFGHVRGAFTGAYRERVGRFQLADGGTLFLDEVGEIPLQLQSKLLRAVQEQEFERIGEDATRKVDVRVVAATNRNLKQEVGAGRFREDLYYRLGVFPIEVPPLRERRDDIVPLALYFVKRSSAELQKPDLRLTRDQGELLRGYDWPGNVRELQHVIARAAILSSGQRLQLDASSLTVAAESAEPAAERDASGPRSFVTAAEFRARERDNIAAALEAAAWRVSSKGGAAELLGLKPTTLDYRIRKLGIKKP